MRLAVLAAATAATALAVPVREFRIDASHSDVAFSIGFLGHPVRGRFDDIRGTIVYAAGSPAASSVTVVIGTKSISTGSAHRDEHLRSSDFFDAAKYPAIVFRSTSIVPMADSFAAKGLLTMHGVARSVTIPFRETVRPIEDPHGSTLLVFSGHLRVARSDYGVVGGSKFNDWFDELRSATMADSVDITLDITGWDPDPARTPGFDAAIKRLDAGGGVASVLRHLRDMRALRADTLNGSQYEFEQTARALAAHGRLAESVTLMQFSAEAFPRDASVHDALARAFELAGSADSARAHTIAALSLDSLDTRALELARRLPSRHR